MKELELLDKAMNVGYTMLMGIDEQIIPSDSNEIEDMVFIYLYYCTLIFN